jgi:hypothetical protein
MFRFTIRDLLWLMVVVGVALLWFNERRSAIAYRVGSERKQAELANSINGLKTDLNKKHADLMETARQYSQQRRALDTYQKLPPQYPLHYKGPTGFDPKVATPPKPANPLDPDET